MAARVSPKSPLPPSSKPLRSPQWDDVTLAPSIFIYSLWFHPNPLLSDYCLITFELVLLKRDQSANTCLSRYLSETVVAKFKDEYAKLPNLIARCKTLQ